jgi:hypothetical protein
MFRRSVVLLYEHSRAGAKGVILTQVSVRVGLTRLPGPSYLGVPAGWHSAAVPALQGELDTPGRGPPGGGRSLFVVRARI